MTASPTYNAKLIGVMAAIAASVIGSAWQIASRHVLTTSLDPLSLAVLRYCIPTLILLPLVFKTGLFPAGVSKRNLLLLVMGGGLPFVLVALNGARFAPVAHMGVLLAAVMPVFTAALARAIYKDKVTSTRLLGFALIGLGVAVLGQRAIATMSLSTVAGDALFLLAALMWAAYSITFRSSGLTPWQGVATVNAWSALMVVPLYFAFGQSALASAPLNDLLLQTLMQGFVAGILGLFFFSIAIKHLGAAQAAAFAALVPVLSTVGGAIFLGEALAVATVIAAALAAVGVVLASGLINLHKRILVK